VAGIFHVERTSTLRSLWLSFLRTGDMDELRCKPDTAVRANPADWPPLHQKRPTFPGECTLRGHRARAAGSGSLLSRFVLQPCAGAPGTQRSPFGSQAFVRLFGGGRSVSARAAGFGNAGSNLPGRKELGRRPCIHAAIDAGL